MLMTAWQLAPTVLYPGGTASVVTVMTPKPRHACLMFCHRLANESNPHEHSSILHAFNNCSDLSTCGY